MRGRYVWGITQNKLDLYLSSTLLLPYVYPTVQQLLVYRHYLWRFVWVHNYINYITS